MVARFQRHGLPGFGVGLLSREFGVGAATINIGPVVCCWCPRFAAPVVGRLADRVHSALCADGHILRDVVAVPYQPGAPLWAGGGGFPVFALGLTMYGPG